MRAFITAAGAPMAPASPQPFTPSGLWVQGVSRVSMLNDGTSAAFYKRDPQRYRELLRALVLETVSDEDELHEELHWLFGTTGTRGAGSA